MIWNIEPGAQAPAAGDSATNSSVAKTGKALNQRHQARQLSASESDTDSKLKNLSIRASSWFSEQDTDINPADVNWIWIQGDRGISVREMNDSWGNAIRYYGKNDGFELRTSGTDGIFYTKDDIFRITTL